MRVKFLAQGNSGGLWCGSNSRGGYLLFQLMCLGSLLYYTLLTNCGCYTELNLLFCQEPFFWNGTLYMYNKWNRDSYKNSLAVNSTKQQAKSPHIPSNLLSDGYICSWAASLINASASCNSPWQRGLILVCVSRRSGWVIQIKLILNKLKW